MNDSRPSLPAHLLPWINVVKDGWPAAAGSVPSENAVQQALTLGAKPGTDWGLAWAMYGRPDFLLKESDS